MRTMQQWLDEYGESHRHPTNKTIHWICVPAILFSVLGLLWLIGPAWLLHDLYRHFGIRHAPRSS